MVLKATLLALYLSTIPLQLKNYESQQIAVGALNPQSNGNRNEMEVFDFIIIGAGSAGSVVANRLSKDSKNRVLVLEEGGKLKPQVYLVPLLVDQLRETIADYNYKTVPQKNACLAKNGICDLTAGRGFGGGSSVNEMIYMRGNPRDYNNWAKITGDSRWSYDKVLPFFKKSEDYHGVYAGDGQNGPSHGQGGELYVGKQNPNPEIVKTFIAAAEQMGLSKKDLNDNQMEGVSEFDFTLKKGRRWGTYQGFLEPILERKNLKVYSFAKATKIHLNKENHAKMVTYVTRGNEKTVLAKKEIILSAGALSSPKLLMLSGIGPKEHLESLGIPCRIDLPVGKNLVDHIGLPFLGPILLNSTGLVFIPERDLNASTLAQYQNNFSGPIGAHPGLFGVAFTKSNLYNDPLWPDLQIQGIGPGLPKGMKTTSLKKFRYGSTSALDYHYFEIILTRPKTKSGELKLTSKNPMDMVKIDPKFFDKSSDLERLVDGVQFALNLVENTEAYKKLNATVGIKPNPKCSNGFEFRSRAYWKCHLMEQARSWNHYVGTCSMGNAGDKNTVVDSELRVLHTTGLRVIDCSVMPTLINANTNAPAIMIGEIGSDLIIKSWIKDS